MFSTMEKHTDQTKNIFKVAMPLNFLGQIHFFSRAFNFEKLKPICSFMCLDFKAWRLKPLMWLFFSEKLYVLCAFLKKLSLYVLNCPCA